MSESENRFEEVLDEARRSYNAPPETPREEMWTAIASGLREERPEESARTEVVDLAAERRRRSVPTPLLWGAAAAALLVLGIGIGRGTAPVPVAPVAEDASAPTVGLALAAQEHLGRTESLLTMVRADARTGSLDPVTAGWARELLAQTRVLMDAQAAGDPTVGELLEDLELLLIQIVGVAEMGPVEDPTVRTELQLTLRGLEEGEVLPRIQAALPANMAGA